MTEHKAALPYPIGTIDADGLDEVEALVADAAAVEGVGNVHEGGSYYAERIIRRAIVQGKLSLTPPSAEAIGSEPIDKLKALRTLCASCSQPFYVEILDEVLSALTSKGGV